jgi:hypothetical protein
MKLKTNKTLTKEPKKNKLEIKRIRIEFKISITKRTTLKF